jgi:LPS-assembly protein
MNHFFIKLLPLCIVVSLAAAGDFPFQTKDKKSEILLKADEISHEKGLGVVVARGNVQISDGKDILEADTVTYNEKNNTVSASGNVKLYRENGDTLYANYVELTEDLKNGFIQKVYLLTTDQQRFAAEKAHKQDKKTVFDKGVYSPCKLCKTDRHAAPTWQLRASQIERTEGEDVHYKNTVLEFKGVPVLYLPYFKHAEPSVQRRSGFLMPFLGNDSDLGMILGAPFYVNISPTQEATIRPILMTKENPLLSGEYAKVFSSGNLALAGSILQTKNKTGSQESVSENPKRTHGHILGKMRFDLTDTWRVDGELAKTTSPTYFKKYYFLEGADALNKNTLHSHLTFEGFHGKNYTAFKGHDFQNLRADISNKTVPTAAPIIEGAYQTSPGRWGEFWKLEASQLYVTRSQSTLMTGKSTERVSSTLSFISPYETNVGIVGDVHSYVRGDLYNIKKFTPTTGPQVNQSRGRLIPSISLSARYPLVNYIHESRFILEPLVKLVALPNNLNNFKYPNEDSQDFELDATNLMRSNRFPGIDKVDDGQRVNYGLNFSAYRKSFPLIKGFMGQSYSFSKTTQFTSFPFSGIQKGISDYVGLLTVTPHKHCSVNWLTRLDRKTLKVHKNLIQISAGPPVFSVSADYIKIARDFYQNAYVKREQITGRISSQFNTNWAVYLRGAKELAFNRGELEHGAGLVYQNDCLTLKFDAFRSFFTDRDIKPSQTIMLTIGLKNLGEFSTGALNLNSLSQDPTSNLLKMEQQ